MSEVNKYQKQGSQASNYVPEVVDNLAENTASLVVENYSNAYGGYWTLVDTRRLYYKAGEEGAVLV